MFIDFSEEMSDMESSTPYQLNSTPNYAPPQYQANTFSTSQSSSMTAVPITLEQRLPSYQLNLQTPIVQNQQQAYQQNNQLTALSTEPVPFQPNSSFYLFNNTSQITFPISSTNTPISGNQSSTEVSTNSSTNLDDKLALIKKFSNESGMNNEWAKK